MAKLLIGNKLKSAEIAKTVNPNISAENKELFNLILAESEGDIEQKIQYFKGLVGSKNFNYFALKRLAQIFHNREVYQRAEDYAIKAFNLNELDSDILEILIHCYANLSLWSKFTFVISKLSKVDPEKLSKLAGKVAEYYLLAAKNVLELGNDKEATNYLQSAFEFNPAYIEALELYLALNINLHQQNRNLEILESAFIANPCFEIMELYFRTSNLPAPRIYEELATIVDPKQHLGLFLAIAAYLNLPEKIMVLKEQKLLPLYNQ
jgi:tetratricopeptide (TPR) repeat protein